MRFEGKTAIVTGGSRGIGRACVARLVAEGATVALLYRSNQAAAESLIAELAAPEGRVVAFQADVADLQRAHQIVDQLFDQWQHIDVLVNSAGIVQDGLLGDNDRTTMARRDQHEPGRHVQLLPCRDATDDDAAKGEYSEPLQHRRPSLRPAAK